MTLEEFKSIYSSSDKSREICDLLNEAEIKIQLGGLAGSAASIIASSVFTNKPGNYLFILPDKEDAAYFFNNLENLHKGEKGTTILFYPGSYRRPYQIEDIDNANIIQRTEVLSSIRKKRKNIMVVTHPEAIIENVVSRKNLAKNTLEIEQGVEYSIDFINELLIEYEFEKLDHVYSPGQFSIRGGIVDIYSFSNSQPYRIEFDGDLVESIRLFDPSTQLSIKTVTKIHVIPNIQTTAMLEKRESFLDYIPTDTKIWIKDFELSKGKIQKGYEKATYVFGKLESTIERLKPSQLYLKSELYENQLYNFSIVEFGSKFHFKSTFKLTLNIRPQPPFNKNFDLLITKLNENTENGFENYIFSEQDSQLERLAAIFKDIGKDVTFKSINSGIHEGFKDDDLKVSCYTDHQIFERYHRFKLKKGYTKSQQAFTLKEIYNLKKGDYVVHIDHGVGQFSGLEKIDVNKKKQEAIRLIYKGGDILYVSIHSLHRISKFTSKDGGSPSLNKLGSPAWNLAKQKTKKSKRKRTTTRRKTKKYRKR